MIFYSSKIKIERFAKFRSTRINANRGTFLSTVLRIDADVTYLGSDGYQNLSVTHQNASLLNSIPDLFHPFSVQSR